MPTASEYLVEIDALDEEGDAVTLRYGTCGYSTRPEDTPANVTFENAISDPGDFEEHLFGPGNTIGESQIGYGNITLSNAEGRFDYLRDYTLAGRPIRIYRLAGKYARWTTRTLVQSGFIERLDPSSGFVTLDLPIRDRRKVLDKPIQPNLYAGTTTGGGPTAEGNPDLKDTAKPLVFGKYTNIAGADANPFDRIFQASDGEIESVSVRDGGVTLFASDPADYATLADLQAALVNTSGGVKTGYFATVLASGLVGVRAAARTITMDVVERDPAYAGSVARAILERSGFDTDDFDDASFGDLDTAAPYDLGVYISDDRMTIANALEIVLRSIGGWIKPDAEGKFRVGRFTGPTEYPEKYLFATDFTTDGPQDVPRFDVCPDMDGHPVYKVTVTYKPLGEVQDASALHDCVSPEDKTLYGEEVRKVILIDDEVLARDPFAAELEIETTLIDQSAAEALAALMMALHGVERDVLQGSIRREDMTFDLGDTVNITFDRLGYETGKNMVLIGRKERRSDDRYDVWFWG